MTRLGVTQRGGQVLARLPAHVKPQPVLTLPDGTWLGFIYPSNYGRRKRGERLLVRIVEYELDDPHRPGHQVHSRLITTLLHPDLYPARELVCLYHERWEVEITIDEIDTHQRLVERAPTLVEARRRHSGAVWAVARSLRRARGHA